MMTAPCLLDARSTHEAELRGWLKHRLGNSVDAENMLQDLFIKGVLAEAGVVRDVKRGRERLWQLDPVQIQEAWRTLDVIGRP